MKRQIAFDSALGLIVAALVAGLIAGAALGTAAGSWLAGRPAASVAGRGQTIALTQDGNAAVARVNPAVVTVDNLQRGGAGSEQVAGVGSGFIIDAQGHIVTNHHVVAGADALAVIFSDGRKAPATLVGSDQFQDVAVLAVGGGVPAVAVFGDSDQLQPGQPVIAIGSALGEFHNTVTEGVVSGGGRSLDTGDGYRLEHLVQHDAPITPGDSGGPLIDASGKVVAMNTAVVTGGVAPSTAANLSFAIEANTVRGLAAQLIASGHVDRPYLGVAIQPARQAAAAPEDMHDSEPMPVVVVQVDQGSPAARAGLADGDQITAVAGTKLDEQHQFLNLVYRHQPGETLTLQVRRDGQSRDVPVTLGQRTGA